MPPSQSTSTSKDIENGQADHEQKKISSKRSHLRFADRIDHFTWSWGTLPMATGGIALLLADQPHTFHGLYAIGVIVFIWDLLIFLLCCSFITARFIRNPGALKASLTHPEESLFFATFFVAVPSIIGCIQKYGVPHVGGDWLIVVIRILFWIYTPVTFIVAIIQYSQLFLGPKLAVSSMTPGWLLPIFPVMLVGTMSSLIAMDQPPTQRLPILVAGVTMQGLGFWVALIVYAVFLTRLFQYGMPQYGLRPGLFISVGPPSFTGLALIGMSQAIPPDYGYFATHPGALDTAQSIALAFAIFIWSLAFWFFCISTISCVVTIPHMEFHLVWWAFIFPNVGFTISTISIGTQLGSQGILWVGSVMTCLLVAMYLFVFVMMVRAIAQNQILWPFKDEDKDE